MPRTMRRQLSGKMAGILWLRWKTVEEKEVDFECFSSIFYFHLQFTEFTSFTYYLFLIGAKA